MTDNCYKKNEPSDHPGEIEVPAYHEYQIVFKFRSRAQRKQYIPISNSKETIQDYLQRSFSMVSKGDTNRSRYCYEVFCPKSMHDASSSKLITIVSIKTRQSLQHFITSESLMNLNNSVMLYLPVKMIGLTVH